MNAILSYLLNAAPEIALALIIGFIAWKVSKRLTKTDNHFTKIDDAISDLQKDVTAIKNDLSDVQLFITSKYPSALGTFVTKNSPLTLNEFGKKTIRRMWRQIFLGSKPSIAPKENRREISQNGTGCRDLCQRSAVLTHPKRYIQYHQSLGVQQPCMEDWRQRLHHNAWRCLLCVEHPFERQIPLPTSRNRSITVGYIALRGCIT